MDMREGRQLSGIVKHNGPIHSSCYGTHSWAANGVQHTAERHIARRGLGRMPHVVRVRATMHQASTWRAAIGLRDKFGGGDGQLKTSPRSSE